MPIMSARRQEPFSEKAESSIYSSVAPTANNRNVFAGNGNPMAIVQPRVLQNASEQNFKNQYITPINSEVKDAILSRLRYQIEQKEEFLKRPTKPLIFESVPQQQQHQQQQQQLLQQPQLSQRISLNFPQPNRLKPEWRPQEMKLDSLRHSQKQDLNDIQSSRFALREQFFKDRTSNTFFSLPTSPYYAHENQPPNSSSYIGGSSSNVTEESNNCEKLNNSEDNRHVRMGSSPIPSQGLRIVSERTKQFESGRPLSPDGIDRTSLYKSELSR
jgi:hypothetical protein